MALPAPPVHSFASDNAAGVHPAVLDAIAAANVGSALAYGDDPWTRSCEAAFRDLFGSPIETLLVPSGTGANVLGLATLLRPVEAVVSSAQAHLAVDEAGAPERILGAKVIDLPTVDGKLRPEQLDGLRHLIGSEHHAQPGVVSLTQSTERGTVYAPAEIAAISERARSLGMRVHMDGARIANAVAALGGGVGTLRAMTVEAGVDVLSFGGTKNGLLGGEAVVFLTPAFAERARFLRKQVNQLASKMRYLAAQFTALLTDHLWLELADHANGMAIELYEATRSVRGVTYDEAPQVNALFPRLPRDSIEPLARWSPFWTWDPAIGQVRWMTAWDTTSEDVAAFAAGVDQIVGAPGSS